MLVDPGARHAPMKGRITQIRSRDLRIWNLSATEEIRGDITACRSANGVGIQAVAFVL